MIAEDKIIRLMCYLSNQFGVTVTSCGTGRDDGKECAVVGLDTATDPTIVSGLPTVFENDSVKYQIKNPAIPYLN